MRLLHGEGGHYSLVEIQSFKEIEGLEADSLNWIFTGTSGVHGTSTTAEDYLDPSQYTWIGDNTVKDVDGEEYQPTITVLVIHPRLVCTRYGDIKVSKKDIEWLRKQEVATLKAIESKLAIKQAGKRTGGSVNDKQKQELINKIAEQKREKYESVMAVIFRIQMALPVMYGQEVSIPEEMVHELMYEIVKIGEEQHE